MSTNDRGSSSTDKSKQRENASKSENSREGKNKPDNFKNDREKASHTGETSGRK